VSLRCPVVSVAMTKSPVMAIKKSPPLL